MSAAVTYYNVVKECYFSVPSDNLQRAGQVVGAAAGYFCKLDGDHALHIYDSTGAAKFTLFNVQPAQLTSFVTAGYLTVASTVPANLSTAPATGWVAPTGTTSGATFATGTVTLPNLAAAVAQIIIDLQAQGLLK